MRDSLKKGFGFGLTSGIITTLGLIVGLNSSTHSQLVVLGGILTIAIADAFSDALGMHISTEYENKTSDKGVWEATGATFISKLLFALSFAVPVLLLPLSTAVIVSIVWGLSLIILISHLIAKQVKKPTYSVAFEHLAIAVIVIIATNIVGNWIAAYFG